MTAKPILIWPDPALAQKSGVVVMASPFDTRESIAALIKDMFDSMEAADGIGLAAPQIGVHRRVIIAGIGGVGNEPTVMINPQVTVDPTAPLQDVEEGCLSVPGFTAIVRRPSRVTVSYIDIDKNAFTQTFDGLNATVVQHEVDHLDGIVYVQHLSKIRRDIIRKKLLKLKGK